MQAFLEYVVKGLVQNPDAVTVTPVEREGTTVYELRLHPQDVGKVMHQILAGQAAGACRFEAPARGSGLDGLSERLQAGLAVKQLPQARAPSSQVASQPAYQLLTSGQWQALPAPQRKRMKVILNQAPRLTLTCEVARSFRSAHPAGKLMVQWLQGPLGRRAVAASGWQSA